MTVLRSGSASDVGRVRTSNQDVALEDPDLFAVADGMGGHVGGEVAARVAVDTLRAAFQREQTVEGLRRAVAEANRAVWRQGQTERGLRGMGTTLTATALVNEEDGRQVIALANVGDSRAYVFSRDALIQVTADHSLAEEKVRQGQLTEAEAAVHPHRHILTRALGVSSDVDVDLWELHLHPGDRILLCSDGLTNEVPDDRIGDILGHVGDPRATARALVKAAIEHGGSDNVTVVVVDVVSADGPVQGPRAADAAAAGAATAAMAPNGDGPGDPGVSEVDARAPSSSGEADGPPTRASGPASGGALGAALAERTTEAASQPGTAAGSGNGQAAPQIRSGATPGTTDRPSLGTLQAAELRRWQSNRKERRRRQRMAGVPRMITFRVVLFFILLAAVVAGAFYLVRWYAMDDWYVGVHDNHLAVYHGRPGGFLWFKPKLVEVTAVTTTQILPFTVTSVKRDKQEPSLTAARSYVHNLHTEFCSSQRLATGGTGPTKCNGTTGSSTTTTTTTRAG